jgi:CheY-like chemotaxis protein
VVDAEVLPVLVLVVEDDGRSARKLAQMLREDGYEVEVATDGAAAIGRLSRSPLPNILVTDLSLPHADGAAVARYARSLRRDIPVLVVTGYPQLASKLRNDLEPEPIVFTKPLVYDDLTAAIRTALDEPIVPSKSEGRGLEPKTATAEVKGREAPPKSKGKP